MSHFALAKHLGVKFLFESDTGSREHEPTHLSFRHIGADVLKSLRSALVLLDTRQCRAVIDTISADDKDLSDRLRSLVDNLQFRTILDALDHPRDGEDHK